MTNSTLPDKGIARRSIVRAGVTGAWAVPAIAIVSAAPAFAGYIVKTGATSDLPSTHSASDNL